MAKKSGAHIVVIGGSFGGIGISQNILASISDVKVTLINISKDWYFNIAAARILGKPNSTPLDKVIFPIKETFFSKFSASQFEFIHASASDLDPTAKTVTLDTSQTINYDYLIIATGSHTTAVNDGIPVKQPTTDTLVSVIQNAQRRIANASTIIIGGSGAVAIEMAGEIAQGNPQKKVTIVSGSKRLLPILSEKASDKALRLLKKLGVEVLLGVRVLDKNENGKSVSINLDNGNSIDADLYIPAVGVIPNSGFIPADLLDASGYVMTNDEQKVSNLKVADVYGIGDVTSNPSKMAVTTTQQIAVTLANLKADIEKTGTRKTFQAEPTTLIVPVGSKGGVAEMGQLGGLVLWSFLVGWIKGNYFLGIAFAISGFKKQ